MSTEQFPTGKPKKVAIIGSEISGMFSAWALTQHSHHAVTIFEKSNSLFNYASTVDFLPPGIPEKCTIDFLPETRVPVDIKPLYFDPKHAPNLTRTINYLRVETITTSLDYGMSKWKISERASEELSKSDKDPLYFSFSENNNSTAPSTTVKPHRSPESLTNPENNRRILRQNLWLPKREIATEWNSSSFLSLFSNLRNIFNAKFYRGLLDYYRFSIELGSVDKSFFTSPDAQLPISIYLSKHGYSDAFFNTFLKHIIVDSGLSLGAHDPGSLKTWVVIYTMAQNGIFGPQYSKKTQVIKGGSRRLLTTFKESLLDVRLNTTIVKITKNYTDGVETSVTLIDSNNNEEVFDYVILAIPPNAVPPMFTEPLNKTQQESFDSYQFIKNQYVLHADSILMPSSNRAWSTMNSVEATIEGNTRNCCTIWGNKLMDIDILCHSFVFITVNPVLEPNPRMVITEMQHKHVDLATKKPRLFDEANKLDSNLVKFVGSWFGTGTLEHGCYSGLSKAIELGAELPFDLTKPEFYDCDRQANRSISKLFPAFYNVLSTTISVAEKLFYVLLVALIGIIISFYYMR